jgi:hypothetical protein
MRVKVRDCLQCLDNITLCDSYACGRRRHFVSSVGETVRRIDKKSSEEISSNGMERKTERQIERLLR